MFLYQWIFIIMYPTSTLLVAISFYDSSFHASICLFILFISFPYKNVGICFFLLLHNTPQVLVLNSWSVLPSISVPVTLFLHKLHDLSSGTDDTQSHLAPKTKGDNFSLWVKLHKLYKFVIAYHDCFTTFPVVLLDSLITYFHISRTPCLNGVFSKEFLLSCLIS